MCNRPGLSVRQTASTALTESVSSEASAVDAEQASKTCSSESARRGVALSDLSSDRDTESSREPYVRPGFRV